MSTQRKLGALLRDLQHARSPLAQARTVARAWRTVRQISPTDRRLLARHLAFDGAEDILDALAGVKGGLAPAMLLQALAAARAADGENLQDLVAALRDPVRRAEAVARGADLAANVLEDGTNGEVALERVEMIDKPPVAETTVTDLPEKKKGDSEPEPPQMSRTGEIISPAEPEDEPEGTFRMPDGQQTVPEVERLSELAGPSAQPDPPMVDWNRWELNRQESSVPPDSQRYDKARAGGSGSTGDLERRDGIGAAVEGASILSHLLNFRRKIRETPATGFDQLQSLVEAFPDGWTRRRAICAVIDEGMTDSVDDALELVSSLGRESDRRWCLGVLAAGGLLQVDSLQRAVELLDTPSARKRITHIAASAR